MNLYESVKANCNESEAPFNIDDGAEALAYYRAHKDDFLKHLLSINNNEIDNLLDGDLKYAWFTVLDWLRSFGLTDEAQDEISEEVFEKEAPWVIAVYNRNK